MYGEKIYKLHAAQRQLLRPLNNQNRENLLYMKQQTGFYWVLFSIMISLSQIDHFIFQIDQQSTVKPV